MNKELSKEEISWTSAILAVENLGLDLPKKVFVKGYYPGSPEGLLTHYTQYLPYEDLLSEQKRFIKELKKGLPKDWKGAYEDASKFIKKLKEVLK